MITRLGNLLRRFRRREDGNPTVEFVLVFPVFMVLMVSAVESGLLMTRQMMLERGVDLSVRAIRLGTGAEVDTEDVRRMVCNGAGILPDCMNQVKVEMITIDPRNWQDFPVKPDCVDRGEEVQVSRNFTNGASHELMLLRVCALFDPIVPNIGIGVQLTKDNTQPYALVSTAVFVMEPS